MLEARPVDPLVTLSEGLPAGKEAVSKPHCFPRHQQGHTVDTGHFRHLQSGAQSYVSAWTTHRLQCCR